MHLFKESYYDMVGKAYLCTHRDYPEECTYIRVTNYDFNTSTLIGTTIHKHPKGKYKNDSDGRIVFYDDVGIWFDLELPDPMFTEYKEIPVDDFHCILEDLIKELLDTQEGLELNWTYERKHQDLYNTEGVDENA